MNSIKREEWTGSRPFKVLTNHYQLKLKHIKINLRKMEIENMIHCSNESRQQITTTNNNFETINKQSVRSDVYSDGVITSDSNKISTLWFWTDLHFLCYIYNRSFNRFNLSWSEK